MMDEATIYLNGIDGETGDYLVPPMTTEQAAAVASGQPLEQENKGWFARFRDLLNRPFQGLPFDVDATDPASAGWGIVFAADASNEVKAALQPLIDHRRKTIPADRCLVLEYRAGETMKNWLKRYGVMVGSVAPRKVPYYLLLVGDPTSIPFEFQYLLDVEYAVGRIGFDHPEQYAQYAKSVIDYETAATVPTAKEVVFWGTRHLADRATQMSADNFIAPLCDGTPESPGEDAAPALGASRGFRSRKMTAAEATRAALSEIFHGGSRPAMLVTASHGMGWKLGHPNQKPAQGALLCQDWPGRGAIDASQYLTAADVADDAQLHGLIAFHFACYGMGTPQFDPFLGDRSKGPVAVADAPFLAALPQRLLSHPNGGALAVIGHIERAWGYSLATPGVRPQLVPFRNLFGRILEGQPVGHATKDLNERYATLSAALLDRVDETKAGPKPPAAELAQTWIERNDAQNYVVLGDPAVRIRIDVIK